MPEVTQAREDDIPELYALLSGLFAQEHEFTPDEKTQAKGLAMIINSPQTGTVLVLREGQAILGMVVLLYTVSTALGRKAALLEDMVIAPASRGLGLGSYLLSNAIEFARAQGCARLTLLTDGDNLLAQRFYERQGFCLSRMVPMRLLLA